MKHEVVGRAVNELSGFHPEIADLVREIPVVPKPWMELPDRSALNTLMESRPVIVTSTKSGIYVVGAVPVYLWCVVLLDPQEQICTIDVGRLRHRRIRENYLRELASAWCRSYGATAIDQLPPRLRNVINCEGQTYPLFEGEEGPALMCRNNFKAK